LHPLLFINCGFNIFILIEYCLSPKTNIKELSWYFSFMWDLIFSLGKEEIFQVYDNKLPRINLDLGEVELGTG
jgi:hypothetical protein